MRVQGTDYRTICLAADGAGVDVIDQTRLPHAFEVCTLHTLDDAVTAITTMIVRGAPLIGATAAYGLALACRADASNAALERAAAQLVASRPTAVNLRWAVNRVMATIVEVAIPERVDAAFQLAAEICDEDVILCQSIGDHGLPILRELHENNQERPVNILTHCNAGWLATVDWGTALAPVYRAHRAGIPVHVWVDETRPRNQGAALTAWELASEGVPHTIIVDNVGGHLMQRGLVDCCITGTDRTTAAGDVCNKIGTYLKALAAHDNDVPFYVALPGPTIDWTIEDGQEIPIEQRDDAEVRQVSGRTASGQLERVAIAPEESAIANYAFDITPARLVTALITERGVCPANRAGLAGLYPESKE